MPKLGLLAHLTVVAALMIAAPRAVRADPTSWRHLCQGLGEFAGLLTDYRNHGKTLQQAVTAAFPELRVMPDRVVAAEVARQVYATPGLDRDQEVAAIFTKCITPAQGEALPKPSTIRIAELEGIPLQPGLNRVGRFASDGRDANIMLTWRDEGGGRGQDVFLVTMPGKDGAGWQRVSMPQDNAPAASGEISDEPHRGDDMLRSLRFARGKVNGENAALLLVASRVESEGNAPSDTTYEVYHLAQKDGQDGFERILRQLLPDRYCNADMALTVASGLPLRSSYRGPRTVEGVFTRNGCNDPKAIAGRSLPSAATGLAALPGAIERSRDMQEQPFQQFSASNSGKAQR